MRTILILLAFSILFIVPLSTDVFAQTSYDVNIPTGAADSGAPYFWQSEKNGSTTGVVEILVGDTIVWKNGDVADHTVTSGSAAEGPDNNLIVDCLDLENHFLTSLQKQVTIHSTVLYILGWKVR